MQMELFRGTDKNQVIKKKPSCFNFVISPPFPPKNKQQTILSNYIEFHSHKRFRKDDKRMTINS